MIRGSWISSLCHGTVLIKKVAPRESAILVAVVVEQVTDDGGAPEPQHVRVTSAALDGTVAVIVKVPLATHVGEEGIALSSVVDTVLVFLTRKR